MLRRLTAYDPLASVAPPGCFVQDRQKMKAGTNAGIAIVPGWALGPHICKTYSGFLQLYQDRQMLLLYRPLLLFFGLSCLTAQAVTPVRC